MAFQHIGKLPKFKNTTIEVRYPSKLFTCLIIKKKKEIKKKLGMQFTHFLNNKALFPVFISSVLCT